MQIQPRAPELRVEAPDALRADAARIRQFDASAVEAIMRMVGLADAGDPIIVLLVPEQTDLARRTPSWIVGFARGDESLVVLFPARSPSYPYDSLEDVLRHEIAHVLIARAAAQKFVPRWFHEGLAMLAERPWGLEDRTRVAFALTGRRWTARDLDAAFEGAQSEQALAYAVSGARVRDILRRHGSDAPARILSRMAAGDEFDLAFARTTGETVTTSEEIFWRDSWWSQVVPFFTSSFMVWLGVTLLALYAIRTRRVRRAEQRRQWEEEERAREETPPQELSDDEQESGPTIH